MDPTSIPTMNIENTHELADGTHIAPYLNSETGQYGVLLLVSCDRESALASFDAANDHVSRMRKNTNTGDITTDDLSELDRSIHDHRAEVLGSVDWKSMPPGLVLTVYQLYSVVTGE